MKFATAKEHRDFFNKNRTIEFEGLLTDQMAAGMSLEVENVLASRLKCSEETLQTISSEKLFLNGRNLWVGSEILKKGEMQQKFGQLAYEFFEQKPIRFGYDQYWPSYHPSVLKEEHRYQDFLTHPHTLAEMSAIQSVIGGLMLALPKTHAPVQSEQTGDLPSSIFPSKAGSGVFFAPDVPLDFTNLQNDPQLHYLLIVYIIDTSVYILNRNDPLLHDFKNMGYVFGDRLNDQFNPIIFR